MGSQVNTARSVEVIDRLAVVHEFSGNLRQCQPADTPTGFAPRRFNADVSAAYETFQLGGRYRAILSTGCLSNEVLHVDLNGRLGPIAGGAQIGRARSSGSGGSIIEFTYEPAAGGGGGGVDVTQVNTLIQQAENSRTIIQPIGTPNNTLVTPSQWSAPSDDVIAEVIYRDATGTVARIEYQKYSGGNWSVDLIQLIGTGGEPTFSITRSTVGPPTINEIASWSNPNAGGEITYAGTTLPNENGANTVVDVLGQKYWYELTSLSPEGWTLVSVPQSPPPALMFHLKTSTSPDNTPRTAADWPGGNPSLGAVLWVELQPLERKRIEKLRWTGGPNFVPLVENLATVVANSHGLNLTAVEGQRVPKAWHFDGAFVSRPPASIDEVTHMAVYAPNANSLVLRPISDMKHRRYSEVTDPIGAVTDTMFWDAATNLHTTTPTELRLFQISDVNPNLIIFDIEDTRTTAVVQTTTSTQLQSDVWQYTAAAAVPAGTPIPVAEFIAQNATTGDAPLATVLTDNAIEVEAGVSGKSHITSATAAAIELDYDLATGNTIVIRRQSLV